MFKILLLVLVTGQDPITILSRVTFNSDYACQQKLEGVTDDEIARLLTQIEQKLGHAHVAAQCVEVDKTGKVVPDV